VAPIGAAVVRGRPVAADVTIEMDPLPPARPERGVRVRHLRHLRHSGQLHEAVRMTKTPDLVIARHADKLTNLGGMTQMTQMTVPDLLCCWTP
jgi:hypothetical protein